MNEEELSRLLLLLFFNMEKVLCVMHPTTFSHMVDAVKNFTEKGRNNPTLKDSARSYIYLRSSDDMSEVLATAVDGYRLAREHVAALDISEPFSVAIKVPRITPTKNDGFVRIIQLDDNTVAVKFGDIMLLSSQPDTPLDVEKLFHQLDEQKHSAIVRLNRAYLRDEVVSLYTPVCKDVYVAITDNPNDPVKLSVGNNERFVLPIRFVANKAY